MQRIYTVRQFTPVLIAVAVVLAAAVIASDTTLALGVADGVNAARGDGQPAELLGADGVITAITNVLLFVAGALSVVMLIIGGLRYVVSGGNAGSVTAAKNTILYAIVGLVIAFLAYAAINFVLSSIAPGGSVGAGGTNV
jgi:hypothetical protein